MKLKSYLAMAKTVTTQLQGKRGLFVFYDEMKKNLSIEDQLEIKIYNKKGDVIYNNKL